VLSRHEQRDFPGYPMLEPCATVRV
jgi:hypothetical protein